MSIAEKKIFLIITSVSVFGLFYLGYSSNLIAKSHIFKAALTQYFECEAFGHVPGKCDREAFEKIYSPIVGAVANFLLGIVCLSILNFVVKWEKIKITGNNAFAITINNFTKVLLMQNSTSSTESSI